MPVINIQEREGDGERRTARGDTAEAGVFRCPCLISHISCATGQMDLMHREQCLGQIQIRDGSLAIRKGSPCQQDDDSLDSRRRGCSGTVLPEDILYHIHSLMTLRDAARAACVSHSFKSSWRCYPNLIFDSKILRPSQHDRDFTGRVDHILRNHSGLGVKTFELHLSSYSYPKAFKYLHRWLQIAVTPCVEKLTLMMPCEAAFNFPCPVLSDGNGSSIWYLHIVDCAFHPTVSLGCLRSLTVLHLVSVQITGDELGGLLSGSVALERLTLRRCPEITYLKIPFQLQRLGYLQVLQCNRLRTIKIKAPNICSFHFTAFDQVEFLLGESLRLKNLEMHCCRRLCYALEDLPSVAPNLETFSIYSRREVINTAMASAPVKFLHLKHLTISIYGAYDHFSLVSFLDAAPCLETFVLNVLIEPECISELLSEGPSHLRQMSGYRHDKLQSVKISRFYSSKSLGSTGFNRLKPALQKK